MRGIYKSRSVGLVKPMGIPSAHHSTTTPLSVVWIMQRYDILRGEDIQIQKSRMYRVRQVFSYQNLALYHVTGG